MTTEFDKLCQTVKNKAQIDFSASANGLILQVGIVNEAFLAYIKQLESSSQVTCAKLHLGQTNSWLIKTAGFLTRNQLLTAITNDVSQMGYEFTEKPKDAPDPAPIFTEPDLSGFEPTEPTDLLCTYEGNDRVVIVPPDIANSIAVNNTPEPLRTMLNPEESHDESWIAPGGRRVQSAPAGDAFDPDNIYNIGKP